MRNRPGRTDSKSVFLAANLRGQLLVHSLDVIQDISISAFLFRWNALAIQLFVASVENHALDLCAAQIYTEFVLFVSYSYISVVIKPGKINREIDLNK